VHIRDRIVELRRVPASELLPNPKNWRRHPDAQANALRAMLADVGIADAVLARETPGGLMLIDGHLRAETDPSTVWPVLVLDVDEEEADKLLLTVDPLAAMAVTDTDALAQLLEVVDLESADLLEHVEGYLRARRRPGLRDPDDAPDPPGEPRTNLGDVWVLGDHRLVCGDCRDVEVVATAVAGEKAAMVWTDPPYGVDYVGGYSHAYTLEERRKMGGGTVDNDTLSADELGLFLGEAFKVAVGVCRKGATWFVAAPAGPLFAVFGVVLGDLGIWRQTLVWLKDSLVMGRSDYHYRHEALLFGWVPGAGHVRPAERSWDSVWEIPRPKRSETHPTMKPVALVDRAVALHTKPGALVLDPFAGSGTTLIAAEQLGRRARLVDIDPAYCDVICARFQAFTGTKPVLEGSGEVVDFDG
jgi:DNA modification methylase